MQLTRKFIPVESDPAHERHLVRGRLDVLAVLRALAAFRVIATVQFSERPDTINAVLLSFKPHYGELVFDGAELTQPHLLSGNGHLNAEATYDYIHVRFSGAHVEPTVFEGAPAFRCTIPSVIARRQRRNSVRFPVPALNPPVVRAVIDARSKTQPSLRVLDVSLGGISLLLEDDAADIAPGRQLSDCRMELPGRGVVITDLEVVHIDTQRGGPDSGLHGRRLGCRFVGVSMLALEHVRSYVSLLERERLSSGRL